jgi:hypothetical protein
MQRGAGDRLDTGGILNSLIVFAFSGAATLMAMGVAVSAHHPLISLAIILFGGFAAVLVHELGHAVAAWLVGWRVWIIHVAPFALRLDGGSFRIVSGYDGPDFAGFVLPSPAAPRHDTKLRAAFISAGGPLASWLMAVVCIAIAAPGPIERYEVTNERTILYALGLFSLAAALGSSLPLYGRKRMNDAARVQAHLDGVLPRRPHAEWAIGLWRYGIEPTHWNAALRSSVDAARTDPAQAWIPAYFEFVAAVRARDAAAAREVFASLGAAFNEDTLNVLEAFVRAAIENDTQGADDRLASIHSLQGTPAEVMVLRQLALAEIDRAGGQTDIARSRLDRAQAQLTQDRLSRQPHWSDLFEAARSRLEPR